MAWSDHYPVSILKSFNEQIRAFFCSILYFRKKKSDTDFMRLIDTHSHLYAEEFDQDIDEVVKRCAEQNIQKIVLPNIDVDTIDRVHNLTDKYPDLCVPLMGLHPTHIKENYQKDLDSVLSQFDKYKYKGVGEIGIDLYWDKTFFKEQSEAFTIQLQFALKKDLPVVIHARDSFEEILEIVEKAEYKSSRGIFHAFTGDQNLAKRIINRGFKIGIGGILTFKNSGLSDTVKDIPLEHIVLETDSPYLAPTPFRGKRNESSYVRLVAEKLSEVKQLPLEEIGEITTKNAIELFQL